MAVKRIVANVSTQKVADADAFYGAVLDLEVAMDRGWIRTYTAPRKTSAAPQISFATEGGSGTAVPDLSIEVDNFDEVLARLSARKIAFEHGPVVEPWGVRRVFVRDPFGRLVNILTHA